MKLSYSFRRRLLAGLLVCALLTPSVALAEPKQNDGRPGRKAAIATIALGWVLGGVGAVQYRDASIVDPSRTATASRVVGVTCMATGGAMVIGGIVMLARRHKPKPETTPAPAGQHPTNVPPGARAFARAVAG
jgi:hypothetical protein